MRGSAGLGAGSGVFSRKGQLFAGGPAEGWLQHVNPAVRLVAMIVIAGTAAFVHHPLVVAGIGSAALVLALTSYLDVPSILRLSLVPVAILALPSWAAGAIFFNVPWSAVGIGLLRVWCSTAVAMVLLHSVGLVNIAPALRRLGLPEELCASWRMMIAQADSFSNLSAEMELARRSRLIKPARGGVIRQLVGGQMGILLARLWQRSRDLGMAMDAREIRTLENKDNAARQRMVTPARLEQSGPDVLTHDQTEVYPRPGAVPVPSAPAGDQTKLRPAALFQITTLSYEFAQAELALDNISAQISSGGCTALLGCNGAGKSTLLHLLAGLLTPSRGEVYWRGTVISAAALTCDKQLRGDFRRAVGIAFQDPDCQWLCDTVQQEVEFGPLQIWPAEEARERAAQVMVMMGVNHLADRAPFTLSGGQKRRVALAGVIATDPDVLLLDEPTLSLDAATTDFLLDWLDEYLATGQKTVILTSHNLGIVRELAHQAIVLTPCHRLARSGPVEEILQDQDFLQQMNLAGRRGRSVLY